MSIMTPDSSLQPGKVLRYLQAFMDAVAASCKTERHHPEWANVYNQVFIRWTTHNPLGLSEKDTKMATLCDGLAARSESQEVAAGGAAPNSWIRQVAYEAASAAGDCCTPSKKQSVKDTEKQRVEQTEREEGAQGSVAGIGGQPS